MTFPLAVENALAKKNSQLASLPHRLLPVTSYHLFEGLQFEILSAQFKGKEHFSSLKPTSTLYQAVNAVASKRFFEGSNSPIQTIQTSKGRGLIVFIENNMTRRQEYYFPIQAFILLKREGKWMVFGIGLETSLLMFLNDLRFHETNPKIEDYLSRLFKGEPCGYFPSNLNKDLIDKVNCQTIPGSLLEEGPRLCQDGTLSLIQLWPALRG